MGEVRIASATQTILRPLLGVTRVEIEATANARGLKWIEDESNDDTVHTRNFLRHEITPRLAERFPHYRASLARAARHANEADAMRTSPIPASPFKPVPRSNWCNTVSAWSSACCARRTKGEPSSANAA